VRRNFFLAHALAALSIAALGSVPAGAASKVAHATAARPGDWTKVVNVTREGGFLMGNPGAKVRLVEYGSLACPHCRHFEETGYKPLLQGYVRTGQVSYEFRNLLLNGPDISVSLLTRCAGPAKFFSMSELVYATQPQWEDRIEKISDADKAALDKMTEEQQIVRFAEIGGMPAMAMRFGLNPARARQCLTDKSGLQRLLAITKAANDRGIDRTPTFIINGRVSDATLWEQLEPELKKALAAGGQGSKAN
jgi:protein-disulfide isomerase